MAGKTIYELSNHLGNVLATITDKKTGVDDDSDEIVDYYNADVTSAQDYYPFGMIMPGRNWSSSIYRYGFNGKENDNDVKGIGNQQDYGMRIYDPRIGRFLSVDPLGKDFPWNSPYAYAENDVIRCIDLDGLEKVIVFGGADLMNTGLSKTTIQTADDIQEFSNRHQLGYEVKTFNVAPWNPSHGTAFDWIKNNYKKDESIIVYGYSMGGVAANQFSKMLKTEGITVNLLVPVDAAWGPFGEPLQVSDNVETAVNFYQTDRSFPILSRGYEAKPQEGNDKSVILNDNWTGKTSKSGFGAHGAMDEDTQRDATNIIKAEMLGKLDEMIKKLTPPAQEQKRPENE